MEHRNTHTSGLNLGNAFRTGIALNILFVIVEVLYGYFSNSMALIADAGHNLSDILALVFSWVAVILSQRRPTLRFTYGFRRSTILIALLNTIILLAAVAFIVWETIRRINSPVHINSSSVIIVAAIGVVINGITAWLFMKSKKHDLNIRSTFIHFMADALVSLGVVAGGIIMAFTGILWVDSLVSFVIIGVILYSSYHLLIDSVNLALDAVPENIDIQAVREYFETLPGVVGIHDLHIWALSTTDAALTVHLVILSPVQPGWLSKINRDLHDQFQIEHATIQAETETGADECILNCEKP
jgi:cobalt-zinc-cadmium efflux system protein